MVNLFSRLNSDFLTSSYLVASVMLQFVLPPVWHWQVIQCCKIWCAWGMQRIKELCIRRRVLFHPCLLISSFWCAGYLLFHCPKLPQSSIKDGCFFSHFSGISWLAICDMNNLASVCLFPTRTWGGLCWIIISCWKFLWWVSIEVDLYEFVYTIMITNRWSDWE